MNEMKKKSTSQLDQRMLPDAMDRNNETTSDHTCCCSTNLFSCQKTFVEPQQAAQCTLQQSFVLTLTVDFTLCNPLIFCSSFLPNVFRKILKYFFSPRCFFRFSCGRIPKFFNEPNAEDFC